jgi:hypothetical protein
MPAHVWQRPASKPGCDTLRFSRSVDDQALIEWFLEERSSRLVPLHPTAEMHACGEMIGLRAVTSSVSQNEIVTKLDRISWPME